MVPRKSRKIAKPKSATIAAWQKTMDEASLFKPPTYDMDTAARVAYETFIKQLGMKIGQKVSDASGVHRIPSWGQHKTFVKARWRAVAQAVIDAATGKRA